MKHKLKHKIHSMAGHGMGKKMKSCSLTEAERERLLEEELERNPEKCYQLLLNSKHLPFSIQGADFKKIDESEIKLQDFVRLVEKKFDVIWYIGLDCIGNEFFERFMFHHGGLMEISMHGKIKCFFAENKCEKMEKALLYAVQKMSGEHAAKIVKKEIKTGQKLISLKKSLLKEGK